MNTSSGSLDQRPGSPDTLVSLLICYFDEELKMPPAARVGDMHVCPQIEPGPVPHVGGPIIPPGEPTVLIGGQPAARMGDSATCTGPPDTIAKGSATVMIGGKPAARMGDSCAHGGIIILGLPTVMVGG